MLSAGLLQKLQPTEGIVGHQRATVKSNLESVNLGDAAPLLVVWGASVLVGVSLLVLERKARRILMERSYVTE
jgi:beta-lactamase regulating signal transducer with metallopeptidase domain